MVMSKGGISLDQARSMSETELWAHYIGLGEVQGGKWDEIKWQFKEEKKPPQQRDKRRRAT